MFENIVDNPAPPRVIGQCSPRCHFHCQIKSYRSLQDEGPSYDSACRIVCCKQYPYAAQYYKANPIRKTEI